MKISKSFKFYLITFFIAFVLLNNGCSINFSGAEKKQLVLHTSSGTHTFNVEIADTSEKRTLGLMHRESLDKNAGMFFIFEKEHQPAFWMKNMLIPLDMVFFDKNMKVVDYFKNVPPCKLDPCPHYIPNFNSLYVLEVNSGTLNEIQLQRGDLAELK
jgi:hypothetical protein